MMRSTFAPINLMSPLWAQLPCNNFYLYNRVVYIVNSLNKYLRIEFTLHSFLFWYND